MPKLNGREKYTEITSDLKFNKKDFFYCLYVKGNGYQIGQAT